MLTPCCARQPEPHLQVTNADGAHQRRVVVQNGQPAHVLRRSNCQRSTLACRLVSAVTAPARPTNGVGYLGEHELEGVVQRVGRGHRDDLVARSCPVHGDDLRRRTGHYGDSAIRPSRSNSRSCPRQAHLVQRLLHDGAQLTGVLGEELDDGRLRHNRLEPCSPRQPE